MREANGSIILLTDRSLKGFKLRLTAVLGRSASNPGGAVHVEASVLGGTNVSVDFPFDGLPANHSEDVVISLECPLPTGTVVAAHTRRFLRAPPPPKGSAIASWQVDHSTKGLLVDGIPFAATGWFGSGGLHESAGLPAQTVEAVAGLKPGTLTLDQLNALSTASVTTEWARQGHTFVKAGPTVYASDPSTAVLSKEYLDAAAAAGVYVLIDMALDGLALAMAGQPKKNHGGGDTNRNLTDFMRWTVDNITHFKDHPAIGGYYGCDDCCHTSIAIEHNLGGGCAGSPNTNYAQEYGSAETGHYVGPGTASGCPGEYWALAEIRDMIFKADPYHLIYGTVARCFGDGSWYWTEEGAGLGLDVVMHEGYGAGITSSLAGFRTFPTDWDVVINMPDPSSLGQDHAVKSHIYAGAISGDGWHINTFVYNPEEYFNFQSNSAISTYANELSELMPSAFSEIWKTNGGGCITPGDSCPTKVNVTITQDIPYYPGQRVDNRPIRILSRLMAETPPPDALPGYYCFHVITVMEASAPLVIQFAFEGLPKGAQSAGLVRLFDADYTVNITADGIAKDILGGKSTAVHRLGCNTHGDMLPTPPAAEMVKGGDMEAISDSGPGMLQSDHHSGPWYVTNSPHPLRFLLTREH